MACTSVGLTATSIVYVGYASSSSGTNFSLGTPLEGSTYIAFISVLSTAAVPTASSFAGKWTLISGSQEYIEEAAVLVTSGTTPTVISSYTVPVGGWKIGDCIELEYWITGGTLTANAKSATLDFLDDTLFTFNFLATSSTIIVLKGSVIKTSVSTAKYMLQYTAYSNITTVIAQGTFAYTLPSIINTDLTSYTISLTGTCANGSETITNSFSSAKLIRC